jgi:hypothetical protein
VIEEYRAHQKRITEQHRKSPPLNLFGAYWDDLDMNLKNTEVRPINYKTAEGIILEHEWIGTMPLPKSCRFMYGIYFKNERVEDWHLGGVEVFVEPTTRQFNENHPRQAVQLNRGACLWWSPANTASYMLAKCQKHLYANGIKIIIAYCTQEAGEIGNIYQAMSWDYVGQTQPAKVYYLDNHWVSERTLADKTKWAKGQRNAGMWLKKFEGLESKKLLPKYRYVKLLERNKNKRQAIRELYGFFPQKYPKAHETR